MRHDQFILPQQKEVPPYVWYGRLLTPPECAEIIRLGESRVLEPGKIGNGMNSEAVEVDTYRRVLTSTITYEDAPWLYEKMRDRVGSSNYEYYRYDIHGFHESMVFLRYDFDAEKPGKYEWHQDIGGGISSLRKLSTVTQLSDPADYDGCRLRLFSNCDFDPGHVDQGDTMLFPSYLPHCVTPITRGRRYSLVSWITGPQFR